MYTHTTIQIEIPGKNLPDSQRCWYRWLSTLGGVLYLIGLVGSVEARPQYWEWMQAVYHPQSHSALARASCLTCHTAGYDEGDAPAGTRLNPFGLAFKSQPKWNKQGLQNIEALDSDGDGWPNGMELRRGMLPGDATSHPNEAPIAPSTRIATTPSLLFGKDTVNSILSASPMGWLPIALLVFLATATGLGILLCYLNWRVLRLLAPQRDSLSSKVGTQDQDGEQQEEPVQVVSENPAPPTERLPEIPTPSERSSFSAGSEIPHGKGSIVKREYVVRSEINQREDNEDSFQVYDLALTPGEIGLPVLAIADGMGGHAHGEQVSREALRKTSQALFDQLLLDRSINLLGDPCPIDNKVLMPAILNALQQADAHIRRMVEVNHWGKAGSTLVMAIVLEDSAVVANLGDSPLFHYQYEEKRLIKVTEDHTVAGALLRGGLISPEMAQVHEGRSRLEFFIGGAQFPKEPLLYHIALSPGDLLLLCSDGVSGALAQSQISQILTEGYGHLERQADNLLKAALETGETDNQTLILWQHFDRNNEENANATIKPIPTACSERK